MNEGVHGWVIQPMLCDYAEVADGKLFILGGGWSICGPGPFTHALAIKIGVPWELANRRHKLEAVLIDEDGQPVLIGDDPSGIRFEAEIEVGRPPGLPAGTYLDMPMAVNFGPIELAAGKGFAWTISVDGTQVDLRFRTRSA